MRVGVAAARSHVLAALIVPFMVACGSSSTGPNQGLTAAELAGTYDLVSITFQGSPPLSPPAATGTLTLTLTDYKVTLSLPPDAQEVDSGTYTVSGNQWTQSSSVQPVQSVGTAALSHDTLSVNVTTAGMQVSNVWKKQ